MKLSMIFICFFIVAMIQFEAGEARVGGKLLPVISQNHSNFLIFQKVIGILESACQRNPIFGTVTHISQ